MYIIVTLLAIYQLAISAFASNDIRTMIERHMLLSGDLLLLLPLLAVPLGCRLLVRRLRANPRKCLHKSCDESSRSSSEYSRREVSEGSARNEGNCSGQHRAVAELCRGQAGGPVCGAPYAAEQQVSGARMGTKETGGRDAALQGLTLSGTHKVALGSASKCVLQGGHIFLNPEREGRIKALQRDEHAVLSNSRQIRSKPVAIRCKDTQPSFDDYIAQMNIQTTLCGELHPQPSSDSDAALSVQQYKHNLAFAQEIDDALPPSTCLLSDVASGEICCLQHESSDTDVSLVRETGGYQRSSLINLSPLQCARTLNFWLLFGVFGTGTGCGLLLINNIGESTRKSHIISPL